MTWVELERRASAFARSLAARGVRAGGRIAVVMPNRPGLVIAVLGGLKAGVTVAPLDPLLKAEERAEIIADLRPAAVVEDVDHAEYDAQPAAPPSAPALILYTSGSTGRPKGAVLSHAALAFANRSWAHDVMTLTPDDVVLAALPLAHSYGLNGALLAPLLAGSAVALLERFGPEAATTAIAHHRVTVLPGVAAMFRRLLDTADLTRLATLRLAVSGAGPCPWPLVEEWRATTGVRILRGYGMTEVFRPISYLCAEAGEFDDAIGRPVPGVEVRVADDDGRDVPLGETGELLIRSPATMDGYLDADAETRAVLQDGWFSTGDLARLGADGCVRIVGRKRERIVRGGYSVFPSEVEAVLIAHPEVGEAAVIAVPHPELGEEVAAFVSLHSTSAIGPDDLLAWCKARLAPYKYPRSITIVDALPRSATGKILKSRLR